MNVVETGNAESPYAAQIRNRAFETGLKHNLKHNRWGRQNVGRLLAQPSLSR